MPPARGPRSGDNRPHSANRMTCCSRDGTPCQALPEPLPPGARASLPRGWDTAFRSAADTGGLAAGLRKSSGWQPWPIPAGRHVRAFQDTGCSASPRPPRP